MVRLKSDSARNGGVSGSSVNSSGGFNRNGNSFGGVGESQTYLYDFKAHFKVELKTDMQKHAYGMLKRVDYLFLIGPAGVGKSFIATALGIRETVNMRAGRLVLTRPIQEAEESLGFLPGTFEEKVAPYLRPLHDQMFEIFDDAKVRKQFEKEFVEVAPLAYMRGRTFSNSVCILDEAQNCTYSQLKMYLTRLGHGGKMIITGDPAQLDIGNSGLLEIIDRCKHRSSVGVVEFKNEDNVRHPSVEAMLEDL